MKRIALTKGMFALVDDSDFGWLNQWKWYCSAAGYAVRERSLGNNKSECIFMHKLVNNSPIGYETDHINRNTLDNQRINLRTVTHAQNMFNRTTHKNNTSGYRGVNWHKETNKWRAYISVNGKQIYLGIYSDIKEAIKVRQKAETKYHAIRPLHINPQ